MLDIRTVRIMTDRALLLLSFLVNVALKDRIPAMTVQAEVFRFRDKKKIIRRAMGQMADPAATGCERPVDILFPDIEGMAFEAELLDRHNKLVGGLFVARLALFRTIRPMVPVASFLGPRFQCYPLFPVLSLVRCGFIGVGYPVKEETEHFIAALCLASGKKRTDKTAGQCDRHSPHHLALFLIIPAFIHPVCHQYGPFSLVSLATTVPFFLRPCNIV
jgi:hypothetical protein